MIYLAGPVIRGQTTHLPWANSVYDQIYNFPFLRLPQAEPELDAADATAFFEIIRDRIGQSDGVISVLPTGDASGPVESMMAAMLAKPQLIVSEDRRRLPRVLLGLPRTEIVDGRGLRSNVLRFMEYNRLT
jgi:hypothetical protein